MRRRSLSRFRPAAASQRVADPVGNWNQLFPVALLYSLVWTYSTTRGTDGLRRTNDGALALCK